MSRYTAEVLKRKFRCNIDGVKMLFQLWSVQLLYKQGFPNSWPPSPLKISIASRHIGKQIFLKIIPWQSKKSAVGYQWHNKTKQIKIRACEACLKCPQKGYDKKDMKRHFYKANFSLTFRIHPYFFHFWPEKAKNGRS